MKENKINNYLLPNNKPIDEDAVIAAMQKSGQADYFLDAETGQVVNKETDDKRSYKIPVIAESRQYEWALEFSKTMLPSESPQLAEKLLKILKTKNWQKEFNSTLEKDESGWIHGWVQWESDMLFEEYENWLDTLPIEIKENPEIWDDDCPLCRMMRDGVDDLETIKRGFHEVNAKQMVDGIFTDKRKDKKGK